MVSMNNTLEPYLLDIFMRQSVSTTGKTGPNTFVLFIYK